MPRPGLVLSILSVPSPLCLSSPAAVNSCESQGHNWTGWGGGLSGRRKDKMELFLPWVSLNSFHPHFRVTVSWNLPFRGPTTQNLQVGNRTCSHSLRGPLFGSACQLSRFCGLTRSYGPLLSCEPKKWWWWKFLSMLYLINKYFIT